MFESAYSESASSTLDEFEARLLWYFDNNDDINVVIGSYITYVRPSAVLPAVLPMTLVVLHRNGTDSPNNPARPQRISFGTDADHTKPIEFVIHLPTLFGDQPAPVAPESISVDIRYLRARIIATIQESRREAAEVRGKKGSDQKSDPGSSGGDGG